MSSSTRKFRFLSLDDLPLQLHLLFYSHKHLVFAVGRWTGPTHPRPAPGIFVAATRKPPGPVDGENAHRGGPADSTTQCTRSGNRQMEIGGVCGIDAESGLDRDPGPP